MTKEGFLIGLKKSLEDSLGPRMVEEHVKYYKKYIEDEMKKGRSEKEVIEELGDPWVIAKSIIDMTEAGVDYESSDEEDSVRHFNGDERTKNTGTSPFVKILIVLALIGIAFLVLSVVGHLIVFLPKLILMLAVVMLVVKLFNNIRR